jgi:F-type H+-transporting ATPase subunit alpha
MVELLKQPQYQPMDVTDQIVTIFAGSTGILDDLDIKLISEFETRMHRHLKENCPDLLTELKTKGDMDEHLADRLAQAITDFKKIYKKEIREKAGWPKPGK